MIYNNTFNSRDYSIRGAAGPAGWQDCQVYNHVFTRFFRPQASGTRCWWSTRTKTASESFTVGYQARQAGRVQVLVLTLAGQLVHQ